MENKEIQYDVKHLSRRFLMRRRHSGILPAVFSLLLTFLLVSGVPSLIAENTGKTTVVPAVAQYKEDFNGDGSVNMPDVIFLLLLARDNPSDPRADYNGDGTHNIVDAIALLLSIRDGKLTPIEEEPFTGELPKGIVLVTIPRILAPTVFFEAVAIKMTLLTTAVQPFKTYSARALGAAT